MNTALCWKRFTRFPADRNTWCGLIAWKTTTMRMRPAMTGSTPLSPPLSRATQARRYSPRDWATSSGGTSTSAPSAAVGSGTCSGASIRAIRVLHGGGGRGLRRRPPGTSGCHVLDDTLTVEGGRPVLRNHPAEMEHGDPVGDLEDVVEVVGYQHHRQSAI